MKKYIFIIALILSLFPISSCVKDLDVTPKDPNQILAGNLNDNPEYMKEALAKIYASFAIAGQGANGGPDIASADENFFTTLRALWNLQEITTDEAMCAWGDVGISDLNTQTWSPSNPFLTALYQRLTLSVTYANDFIRLTKDSDNPTYQRYNAEARFLRALAYYWLMDLFGNPPFTTEKDGVGTYYPRQIQRDSLFAYIESELLDIQDKVSASPTSYPRANQAAVWMLLARMYLNAEVYTGTPRWDDVILYTDKVINSGQYSLDTNYRQNFCADNDGLHNPEMIFGFVYDGIHIQGYTGTTFIIESSSDPVYLPAETFHGLTSNTNWNGNRARREFLNVMIDTATTYAYNGGVIDTTDYFFSACPDKRVFLRQKKSVNIPAAGASGDYGVGVYKFTAKNSDGSQAEDYNPAFASTDFPIFRLADAYLMRAEAEFRTGKVNAAVDDINVIRERAFGNSDHDITASDLTLDFILDERGREFYYEAQRRTDLIRFGKFTGGDYVWQWKGGTYNGTATDSHLNLFPIPGDEISANPNMKQNPGY